MRVTTSRNYCDRLDEMKQSVLLIVEVIVLRAAYVKQKEKSGTRHTLISDPYFYFAGRGMKENLRSHNFTESVQHGGSEAQSW